MWSKVGKYFLNILISIDQFVNTLCGGDPDETISSRVFKDKNSNKVARLVWQFLELIDKGHGRRAEEKDEGKDKVI